jgi:DNA (cytosine-5)-methyltransferase 1
MSVVGLFAGIGGFEKAFADAGFETELLVEIDSAAAAVLRARFPDADIRADVAELADIPSSASIITAGFPCQNLSMAGDKSGIDGGKSRVVHKMFGLIEQSHVPTVVVENVYFMLQLDKGSAMDWLVGQFERLEYSWAYRVLNTMAFGLPHRRRRVYFVASRTMDPRGVLFAEKGIVPEPAIFDNDTPIGFYWTEGRSGVGLTPDGIPPLKVGSGWGIVSAPAVLFPDGEVLMPSLGGCERLQGFEAGWTTVEHAPPKGAQWRMIGNAVSVPVARWVAKRIKTPGEIQDFECIPLLPGDRWPDAAWNVGDGRVRVVATDQPVAVTKPSIATFRDAHWTRLSDRALDGFIKRATEGGLTMPEGFVDALRTAPRKANSKPRA